jgi:hypothetical protein
MTPPRISALVTCRNYGRYLAQCLESLRGQTLPFSEIIVLDDDSGDETPAVAARFTDGIQYHRVNFHNLCRARQRAYDLSTGEFVVPVDADNWLLPEYNEKLIAPLLEREHYGWSYCGFHYAVEKSGGVRPPAREHPMIPFDPEKLRKGNYIDNCSMVRRQAWLGLDPDIPGLEDWDHWMRLSLAGWDAALVPERLFYYRVHEHSQSQTLRRSGEKTETFLKVWSRYLDQDLTILTIFDGDGPRVPAHLKALAALRRPPRTQHLILDTEGQPEFLRKLRDLGADAHVYTETSGPLFDFLKPLIKGKKVLLWALGVLPCPDALARLSGSFASKKADFMGAAVVSTHTAEYAAWRPRGGQPENGIYPVPLGRSAKRVFASGFSFLMTTAADFLRLCSAVKTADPFFSGAEANAGLWARDHARRWFAEGSLRCYYLDESGAPVRPGEARHAVTGRLEQLQRGVLKL